MKRRYVSGQQFLYIGILLLIAVYSTWLVKQTHPSIKQAKVSSSAPDAFGKNIYAIEYNADGQLYHELRSPAIKHYPDNSSYFVLPSITIYSPTQPNKQPWHITAKQGFAYQGSETIKLLDDVVIQQAAGPNNNSLTIQTNKLFIYPNKNLAVTDAPIIFIEPGVEVHSVGMRAYLKEKRVDLLNQARGTYDENQTTHSSP